jgi:arsenate reductase-like glutaredoxin family protein
MSKDAYICRQLKSALMPTVFYLETCKTCQKALAFLAPTKDIELVEIKSKGISKKALDQMAKLAGSYGALFSKRAILYRQRNLSVKALTETDYRSLILEHYTFLKRPVVVTEEAIFIGNSKAVLEAAKQAMHR